MYIIMSIKASLRYLKNKFFKGSIVVGLVFMRNEEKASLLLQNLTISEIRVPFLLH